MLSLKDAHDYVTTKTKSADKYREYAVSDFLNYRTMIQDHMEVQELQKTWALYLKWKMMCDANPQQWSSANGRAFTVNLPVQKFNYTLGTKDTPPTLGTGAQMAIVKGVGQCEYFATQAFQMLKTWGKEGTVPRVDKIATPGHNWVIVNYSDKDPIGDNLVAVDAWLLALGVPRAKCICPWKKAAIQFSQPFKFIETFNPDKQD
jgi:hypothetical protein